MSRALVPLALLALVPLPAAEILEVAPIGAEFSDIQPAIDAAAPGDVILVGAGVYSAFSIDKPVVLLGAGSNRVSVESGAPGTPYAEVHDTPPGAQVVVSGIALAGLATGATSPVLRVANTAAPVVLNDVAVSGADAMGPVVEVTNAQWALFGRLSASATTVATPPETAVFTGSRVWLGNSSLRGAPFSTVTAESPTPALRLVSSTVYAARTGLRGGDGFVLEGRTTQCWTGAPAVVAEGSTVLKLVGGSTPTIVEGEAETAPCNVVTVNAQGAIELYDTSEAVVTETQELLPSLGIFTAQQATSKVTGLTYPTLSLDKPSARPGEAFQATLEGNPGAAALPLVSVQVANDPLPFQGVDGALILDLETMLELPLVFLDASGGQLLSLAVPPQPSLFGLLVSFQWFEIAALSHAISNPSFLAIR